MLIVADDIQPLVAADSEAIRRDPDKVHQRSVRRYLPLNLNTCQWLMEGETNSPLHVGQPGNQAAMDQTQQVRDLRIVVSAHFKFGLQSLKSVRKVWHALNQLKRTKILAA